MHERVSSMCTMRTSQHNRCSGQVLCFPQPADVPGAAHGPAEHGGLHWPDSAGLAYEVSSAVSMCLCKLLQSMGILDGGNPIHYQSHLILGLKLRPDLAQQGQHASNIRRERLCVGTAVVARVHNHHFVRLIEFSL